MISWKLRVAEEPRGEYYFIEKRLNFPFCDWKRCGEYPAFTKRADARRYLVEMKHGKIQ